jgi:putative transposase
MLRIRLTDEQVAELARLRRDKGLRPAERDRVEMVALSAAGWPVPRIAAHLGYCAETVRRLFRRFPTEGWEVVRHQTPGPAPDAGRRAAVEAAVRTLLAQERTWTAGQLAEALGAAGIMLSPRQLRRYLRRLEAGWYRTKRSVKHRQDPEQAAAASEELAVFENGRRRAR